MIKKIALLSLIAAIAAPALRAELLTYEIDPVHSGITFKIRHFVNRVPGEFNTFKGTIAYDAETPEKSSTTATIDVSSVNTRNEKRDAHLRGEDYFNAEANPEITFTSTSWKKIGENKFEVTGDLTMLGQTHSVTLDVELLGKTESRGNEITGWLGTTTLDRTKWGMSGGAGMLGNDVEVELNIQARRKL